jgi:ABC-2 type transport system ATP-binding protein
LNPPQRLNTLSKGQTAKAGLLIAQAHRPDLLLLDEPSSGLDPLVRRDILEAVIRTVADEGRTVLFSSHLLEEIERVSDHVAMINRGRVIFCGALEAIKSQHRRFVLHFENALEKPPKISGAISVSGTGKEWAVMCNGAPTELSIIAAGLRSRIVDERAPSFNEIFVAHAGANT